LALKKDLLLLLTLRRAFAVASELPWAFGMWSTIMILEATFFNRESEAEATGCSIMGDGIYY